MAMTDSHDTDDLDLERFFRAARQAPPEPSMEFLARLAAEGAALQSARMAPVRPPRSPAPRGVFAALAAALGGWGALGGMAGGMATATVAGLWIGLAQAPTMLQAVGYGTSTVSVAEAGPYLADGDVLSLAMTQ